MSGMSERGHHDNPYRAPEARVPAPIEELSGFLTKDAKSERDERIANLPKESIVRTIGLIHVLMSFMALATIGVVMTSAKLGQTIATQAAEAKLDPAVLRAVMIGGGLFGFILFLVIGLGLRGLKNWARWTLVILSALGLLGKVQMFLNPKLLASMPTLEMVSILLGTALTIAMLVILLLPASDFVCSRHYHFVISETREIRPKMGLAAMLLLGAYLVTAALGLSASF